MSLILSKVNVTMGFLACRVLGCQQNKSGVMAQWLAAAIPLFQRELEREALDLTRLGGCNGWAFLPPRGHQSAPTTCPSSVAQEGRAMASQRQGANLAIPSSFFSYR